MVDIIRNLYQHPGGTFSHGPHRSPLSLSFNQIVPEQRECLSRCVNSVQFYFDELSHPNRSYAGGQLSQPQSNATWDSCCLVSLDRQNPSYYETRSNNHRVNQCANASIANL